jgi:hypothetical protein
MIVVGLCGFKQSGKGEVAKVLEREFGFVHWGFADALRSMMTALNPVIILRGAPTVVRDALSGGGVRRDGIWAYYNDIIATVGYDQAKSIPDVRSFLQRFGTEVIRDCFGKDAWVDLVARRAEREGPSALVLSDVRFRNEYAWIQSQRGVLWRVVRPLSTPVDTHVSETEMIGLPQNHVLHNDGTLVDLEAQVVALVEAYRRTAWTLRD